MTISDAAQDKAKALVSQYEAQVATLSDQLKQAEAQLQATGDAGDLLDKVKDTPVIGSLLGGARDEATVSKAQQQADVDTLKAELSEAQTKLDWARKAQGAVEAVTDGDEG
ncbi:MAG: hypothetical protein E6Q90_04075 [Actinobacteria bacterium]|nr:MAG: hypothetical protein E6Q90_04075 [Actinomycetota bacterium]